MATPPGPAGPLTREVVSEGASGANLEAEVDHAAGDLLQPPDPDLFNTVRARARPADFVPSGAVTGVIARTDAQRGVGKASAGQERCPLEVGRLARQLGRLLEQRGKCSLAESSRRTAPGRGPAATIRYIASPELSSSAPRASIDARSRSGRMLDSLMIVTLRAGRPSAREPSCLLTRAANSSAATTVLRWVKASRSCHRLRLLSPDC